VQQVRETAINVHPNPAFMHHRKDYYGNDVTSFEVLERHDRLEAMAESTVEVQPEPRELPTLSWEEARDGTAAQGSADCIEAAEIIYTSPHVPSLPQLGEYARKTF